MNRFDWENDEIDAGTIYLRLLLSTAIKHNIGAEGRTRTGTALRHRPLKTACLPIPPLRQKITTIQLATVYLKLVRVHLNCARIVDVQPWRTIAS